MAKSHVTPKVGVGVGLHKLSGSRKGQWAMTVNSPWRICFLIRKGDACDVEIVNYHKG